MSNNTLVLPPLDTLTLKGNHKVRKELLRWLKNNKLPKASISRDSTLWRIGSYNLHLYGGNKFFIADKEELTCSVYYGFRQTIVYNRILKILKKSKANSK